MKAIIELLSSPDWDRAFFKRLAHNDTGQAAGHQGGVVIPKDLRLYFPTLDEAMTSSAAPTTDRHLLVEMYIGVVRCADAVTRYQFQTWGGTRSAESRITDNLGSIRNTAKKDDILVFQRRSDALDRYRLILVQKESEHFPVLTGDLGKRKWGPLILSAPPVTQSDLQAAKSEVLSLAHAPFQVTKDQIKRAESRTTRIARSSVFRENLRKEYSHRCCVSGISITTPDLLYEVEAAHVVPVSEGGSDDLRNGFLLTQTLHWAFDRGLFGLRPDRKIYVPRKARAMPQNSYLNSYHGKPISEANAAQHRVHAAALDWHFTAKVRPWD